MLFYDKNLFDILACPNCGGDLSCYNYSDIDASLSCKDCSICYPVINSFPIFSISNFERYTLNDLKELKKELFGNRSDYDKFVFIKEKKKLIDPYCALHPINESTRTINCFIENIKTFIAEGDIILDMKNWNGFSGDLLANQFKDNLVISLCEIENSPLGYQGFNYWYKNKPENLVVIFINSNSKLPIKSDSIFFLHGYDIVHHKPKLVLTEAQRVVKKSRSVILLPHIHLGDGQPEPFFERGGKYIHSNVYKTWLSKLFKKCSIEVFGEQYLFNMLKETKVTHKNDYNGVIAISSEKYLIKPKNYNFNYSKQSFIINPLLKINLLQKVVKINNLAIGSNAEYFLNRHPIYNQYINKNLPFKLSLQQIQIILEINSYNKISSLNSNSEIVELLNNDIICPFNISDNILNLFKHYTCSHSPLLTLEKSLIELDNYIKLTIDDVELNKEEYMLIINSFIYFLIHLGISRKIIFYSKISNSFDKLFFLAINILGLSYEFSKDANIVLTNQYIKVSNNIFYYTDIVNKKIYKSANCIADNYGWFKNIYIDNNTLMISYNNRPLA
ncbi:hypothetical protein FRA_33c05710 [Francisella sp. W12-1067]|nr:hypothetical protein FRA_33c05710 [Francisella sp. W12-1067]